VIAQEPLASSSDSSPSDTATMVSSGLAACEYAEIRASAHRVLQFLDKAHTTSEEWDGVCLD
jgi:hypothetical protein